MGNPAMGTQRMPCAINYRDVRKRAALRGIPSLKSKSKWKTGPGNHVRIHTHRHTHTHCVGCLLSQAGPDMVTVRTGARSLWLRTRMGNGLRRWRRTCSSINCLLQLIAIARRQKGVRVCVRATDSFRTLLARPCRFLRVPRVHHHVNQIEQSTMRNTACKFLT